MCIIYAILLNNGKVYIGMTNNLEQRIRDHKRGKTKTIKNKQIIKVGIIEKCDNRILARQREIYWKSGCGREKLKAWAFSSVG